MPTLNEVIQINVSRQTTAVPQTGFGNVLILSFETPKAGTDFVPGASAFKNFKAYSESDDFSDDFETTSEVYKTLRSHFSQSLTPRRAFVGYVLSAATTADPAGDGDDPDVALNRILNATKEFYAVIPVGASDDKDGVELLKKVADWVESQSRICFIQTTNLERAAASNTTVSDPLVDADDIGLVLKVGNSSRTSAWYSASDDNSLAGAITGRCLTTQPGSITFAYKSLSGITSASLSTTQITNLDTKNYNYFTSIAGNSVTFNGKMADGGFIDLIRDSDWLVSSIQDAVLFQLINLDKIPYTEDGANIIQSSLNGVLETAVRNGVIDDGYTVRRDRIADIPQNDRANRKFPQVDVSGRFTGAVHSASFSLVLSV